MAYINLGSEDPTLAMNVDFLEEFSFGYVIDLVTKKRILENAVP
jgi:hypothetical protein